MKTTVVIEKPEILLCELCIIYCSLELLIGILTIRCCAILSLNIEANIKDENETNKIPNIHFQMLSFSYLEHSTAQPTVPTLQWYHQADSMLLLNVAEFENMDSSFIYNTRVIEIINILT